MLYRIQSLNGINNYRTFFILYNTSSDVKMLK